MVNTQAILRSDLFLNAIRAAGGSSRHSSLQEQFNLRDWDLGEQQKDVTAFMLIASTVKVKGQPKLAKMAEAIKKQAREYKAAMIRYNRAELGEEWKHALNARTIYDALIPQCYELCMAAGPRALPALTSNHLLLYMLADCKTAREETVRWELEGGNDHSVRRQYENLKCFFAVTHGFDVDSAPEDKRAAIRPLVIRVQSLARSYFAGFKKWRRSEPHAWTEDVAALCHTHSEGIAVMRDFCGLAFPSSEWSFVDRFGLSE